MTSKPGKSRINILGKSFTIPGSPFMRLTLGIGLIVGGVLGFLPVLGFWMIPLGLVVLSVDHAGIRRFRRLIETSVLRWWQKRKSR